MNGPQTRPAVGEGEAPAAGRDTCAWAGCRRPAVEIVVEWPMCAPHRRMHHDLERDVDRPVRTRPSGLPPTDTGACGSRAGEARHRRRGEKPCDPCRVAANAHSLESKRKWRAGRKR